MRAMGRVMGKAGATFKEDFNEVILLNLNKVILLYIVRIVF